MRLDSSLQAVNQCNQSDLFVYMPESNSLLFAA